ncbi:hypothetical protein [Streptomyces sp. 3214.6]|uniref:hypothetical protein n=1 Tax=Streptomyces sp. 3214.6 TaxID=1882757 RepID=UPI001E5E1E0D
MQLSFLPDTCADGARIVTGARALRILLDHDRPGPPWAAGIRADGSELEILSPPPSRPRAHCILRRLLRRSGLGGHPRLGRNLSLSYLPSVGQRRSFVRSSDPGIPGMAVSLSPSDGSNDLVARNPATARPRMGIRGSIAVQANVGEVVCGTGMTTSWQRWPCPRSGLAWTSARSITTA